MNDREKLIALLGGNLPHHSNDVAYWQDEHIGALADHLIANGVTIQRWIPVTERLPEVGEIVLVCGNRGGIYTARLVRDGRYAYWHKLNSKNHYCKPTHWMPIPQPPKEVE